MRVEFSKAWLPIVVENQDGIDHLAASGCELVVRAKDDGIHSELSA